MASPTQQQLRPDDVAAVVADALGDRPSVCTMLSGGEFAAVWRADLSDGRSVVLKVGPSSGVDLLQYEADLIRAEAEYLRLVAGGAPRVPVARVLAQGSDGPDIDGDWLLTTFLRGTPLPEVAAANGDATDVRRDVGSALASVHRITGDRFGYTGDRPHAATWREAFRAIVESLLDDGVAWGVGEDLLPAHRVRAALDRHGATLDAVERPALVHFDLWDGNVLARLDEGTWRLGGLVDGERFLFGDPLVDLVSPVIFRRIEDEPGHPLLDGYAQAAGAPLVLDDSARTRLALYRMWLYVLMVAENPSRGRAGQESEPHRAFLAARLAEELDLLGV